MKKTRLPRPDSPVLFVSRRFGYVDGNALRNAAFAEMIASRSVPIKESALLVTLNVCAPPGQRSGIGPQTESAS